MGIVILGLEIELKLSVLKGYFGISLGRVGSGTIFHMTGSVRLG